MTVNLQPEPRHPDQTRRGLLKMLAAGVAAPFIPSEHGVLMPVREIEAVDWGALAEQILNDMRQAQQSALNEMVLDMLKHGRSGYLKVGETMTYTPFLEVVNG